MIARPFIVQRLLSIVSKMNHTLLLYYVLTTFRPSCCWDNVCPLMEALQLRQVTGSIMAHHILLYKRYHLVTL
jgi:hypothetical protein